MRILQMVSMAVLVFASRSFAAGHNIDTAVPVALNGGGEGAGGHKVAEQVVTDCANNAILLSPDLLNAVLSRGPTADFTMRVIGITCMAEMIRRNNGSIPGLTQVPQIPDTKK